MLAQLRAAGASLGGSKSSVEQAAVLCTAVFDGDLPLLRRLILSGVAVDSGDYGERGLESAWLFGACIDCLPADC